MKRHQLRHTLARTGAHILEARNSKHEGNEVSLTLKSAYITALYDLQLISKPSTRLKLSCTGGAWEDLVRMFFFFLPSWNFSFFTIYFIFCWLC